RFLYVGNAKPHKGLGTLLRAFDTLRSELNARLVLIGQTHELRTADDLAFEAMSNAPSVQIIADASPAELRSEMRSATALVHPSSYEGFGLPPLEAMALGCPAIVARAASLPEVCGDAAEYFPPGDADKLA